MGKKNKQFIDKANSQKFHLLHRSQTDEAYSGEGVPSDFVLVAAQESINDSKKVKFQGYSNHSERRDHITADGFKNDGYDYSQHLKEMGGGQYVGASGKVLGNAAETFIGKIVDLPDDVLPSTGQLERDLEAITIDHEVMDEDIRAALFDDCDQNGEVFEDLLDDFVSTLMEQPKDDGFDYDAHIASLVARSSDRVGINRPRGWEDEEGSDEEFPDNLVDIDEKYDNNPTSRISKEQRAFVEEEFEKTMEEYDDGELGYLSDCEEEEVDGVFDLEKNELLESALDEFLQDQKDIRMAEGWSKNEKLLKGNRASVQLKLDNEAAETTPLEVDIKKEKEEQETNQQEAKQTIDEDKKMSKKKNLHKEIELCQEYLQEVRIEEEWDCESVLSTYSTLDNHPTVIKSSNAKFKPYKNRHVQTLEDEDASMAGGGASVSRKSLSSRMSNVSQQHRTIVSNRSVVHAQAAADFPSQPSSATGSEQTSQPGRIVLSGRLSLPVGFGPSDSVECDNKYANKPNRSRNRIEDRIDMIISSSERQLANIKEEPEDDEEEEEEGEKRKTGDSDENDGDDEDDDGESVFTSMTNRTGRRTETAEQKKARKRQVKEERREKRVSKKELRTAFRSEGTRLIQCVGREQSTDHVSVFKYSNK